jgi:DNA-binding NtrC family response regulator
VEAQTDVDGITGTSGKIQDVLRMVSRLKDIRTPVLITGESGTGKELIARAIHNSGDRAAKPFVAVSCAALAETLLESELFGHEKGSFTGAVSQKKGKFELADGGTIFLDEIGDISPKLQADLLRVLQERCFYRVGGSEEVRVDVRVIAATNRDLQQAVEDREFRDDLYYRLNVIEIRLPPLRERRDDIPALVEHFAGQVCAQNGWKPVPFTADAIEALQSHAWPGNVRELRNMVERVMLLATEGQVDLTTVQMALPKTSSGAGVAPGAVGSGALADRVQSFEREVILAELKRSHQNMSLAAKTLGLERSHLYKKAEQLGIDLRAMRREQGPQD